MNRILQQINALARQFNNAVLCVDVIGVDILAGEFDITRLREVFEIFADIRVVNLIFSIQGVADLLYEQGIVADTRQ